VSGTNYYLHLPPTVHLIPELAVAADEIEFKYGVEVAAPIRELGKASLHIGKMSSGWCFMLHVFSESDRIYDPKLPATLEEWKVMWESPGSHIMDEDGQVVSKEKMLALITEGQGSANWDKPPSPKRWGRDVRNWGDIFHRNNARKGPRGLLRSNYGKAPEENVPYDTFEGDFS